MSTDYTQADNQSTPVTLVHRRRTLPPDLEAKLDKACDGWERHLSSEKLISPGGLDDSPLLEWQVEQGNLLSTIELLTFDVPMEGRIEDTFYAVRTLAKVLSRHMNDLDSLVKATHIAAAYWRERPTPAACK